MIVVNQEGHLRGVLECKGFSGTPAIGNVALWVRIERFGINVVYRNQARSRVCQSQ